MLFLGGLLLLDLDLDLDLNLDLNLDLDLDLDLDLVLGSQFVALPPTCNGVIMPRCR